MENSTFIQNEVKKIIDRKKNLNPTQIGFDDKTTILTTILIPYLYTASSQGKPSNHFSLLALKFNKELTKCEPFSITTSGDNAFSAKDVNEGIKKAVPSGIEVLGAIDIVTMQQNGIIPTVDCGAYMIQNAENIAALGLAEATFQIDKNQKKANQPIEGQDVNLRGISLRAKHAITIALEENMKPKVVEMVGGDEDVAKKLTLAIQKRIAERNNRRKSAESAVIKAVKPLVEGEAIKILETKLSEIGAAKEKISFFLGNLGNSSEELKIKTDKEEEITVEREKNARRARPIITPQIISLHHDKSQHRAEFGGVVFDETKVKKNDDGKNEGGGIFNDADLNLANFRGCKFDNVDFSSIDPKILSTISFVNCEFENCNFPKGFKFQQYQFKFKETGKFKLDELTSKLGDKKIPKGIPADKFEDEPSPKPKSALAENLKSVSIERVGIIKKMGG